MKRCSPTMHCYGDGCGVCNPPGNPVFEVDGSVWQMRAGRLGWLDEKVSAGWRPWVGDSAEELAYGLFAKLAEST